MSASVHVAVWGGRRAKTIGIVKVTPTFEDAEHSLEGFCHSYRRTLLNANSELMIVLLDNL
jgi:hypothetical protein